MNTQEDKMEQQIVEIFKNCVCHIPLAKPCSAEWDLCWKMLEAYKEFFEEKHRDE